MGSSLVQPLTDRDHVFEYAARTPLALALERALECQLYEGRSLERPLLDLGCGDGTFAEVLFGREAKIDHGVDFSRTELLRESRKKVYQRTYQASGATLPFADGSLSTILSNSVLEHIPDLDPVLREAFRVLKPGGALYITVPTDRFDRGSFLSRLLSGLRLRRAAEGYRRWYNRFWNHYHYVSPVQWADRLQTAGFEVRETIEFDPASRCTMHDLLVPLGLPAFLMNKVIGRYFLIPTLRRLCILLFRWLLPRNRLKSCEKGKGGLVFLYATKGGVGA